MNDQYSELPAEAPVRQADTQVVQSLYDEETYPTINETWDGANDTQPSEASKRHGKLVPKPTPQVGLQNVNWVPRIRVSEWLNHTSKMLFFEWLPLSYFTVAAVVSPIDEYGCSLYANSRIDKLMMQVFAPILLLRFLGLLFMTKPNLIIFQILIIYGYLVVALSIWVGSTAAGLARLPSSCFHPMKVSVLNVSTMEIFYTLMLFPYMTLVLLIPFYLRLVLKNANRQRQSRLAKHYLIKAMPSILFSKKLFDDNSFIECAICMEPFSDQDYVTPLACDSRHFYHSDCIEEWLNNKNECPLCKVQQTPKMMRKFSEKFSRRTESLLSKDQ